MKDLKTDLVAMKPISWVAQRDFKLGLGVNKNLENTPCHDFIVFSSSSSLISWCFHLHPSDDVLVDDLPELELRRHIVVDVVDDPHLV